MKKIPVLVLSASFLFSSSSVYAADTQIKAEQQQTLTYQQALEQAFKTSNVLKNAEADIDRAFEVRQNASDYVTYIPTGYGNGPEDGMARQTVKNLAMADMQWGLSRKSYELTKDSIAYAVKQAYNGIFQAKQQQKLAKLALENQVNQTSIARTKAQYGLMSLFELSQEESKQQAAEERKKAADKAVEDAYQKFNYLVGLSKDARPLLSDEPKFIPFDQTEQGMEAYITQVLSSSTAVWMAEQQLKLKQMNVDLYTFNDGVSAPYKAAEIDVQKAANDVQDTKKNLEQQIRTMFLNIKQLEDRYKEISVDLAAAQKTLDMAKVRYETGVGIKADMLTAELAVENKKKEMFDIVLQLDNLKMAYNMPWVVSGGSKQQGS